MTVRAECTVCKMRLELEDNGKTVANLEDAARSHAIQTGHPVRVFTIEELSLHIAPASLKRKSREPEYVNDQRCLPTSEPSSNHVA